MIKEANKSIEIIEAVVLIKENRQNRRATDRQNLRNTALVLDLTDSRIDILTLMAGTILRGRRALIVWQAWLGIRLTGQTLVSCLVLAGVLSSTMSGAQQTVETAISSADEKKFEDAMTVLNTGDAARAEPLLQDLHSRHPHNYEINESLGLLYASGNFLEKALPFLKAAVQEKPHADEAHANLGAAYFKLGRSVEAERELETAAQLNPSNGQTQASLGHAWMILNQPQKAALAFSAALGGEGGNPDLLYDCALAFFDAGEARQAASLLSRMPGADSSASVQSLYGDVDEKLGNFKEAAQHYANAVQLMPSEANVYALGIDFLRHWTFEAAIKEFQAGVKTYPNSERMNFSLGLAYYGDGNYGQAIPIFAKLLSSDPNNSVYAAMLGRNCSVLTGGSNPTCFAVLTFAKLHPQDAAVSTYAASSILHQHSDAAQLQIAQQLLTAAIHTNPSSAEARYEMGLLLQMEDHWAESIPELEAAIRSEPNYAEAHYRLALAHSRLGRKDRANEEIALQKKYSQQQAESMDTRMQQIKTLLVKMK
jgi:tetratricopeptide (TPR) repeat protein